MAKTSLHSNLRTKTSPDACLVLLWDISWNSKVIVTYSCSQFKISLWEMAGSYQPYSPEVPILFLFCYFLCFFGEMCLISPSKRLFRACKICLVTTLHFPCIPKHCFYFLLMEMAWSLCFCCQHPHSSFLIALKMFHFLQMLRYVGLGLH